MIKTTRRQRIARRVALGRGISPSFRAAWRSDRRRSMPPERLGSLRKPRRLGARRAHSTVNRRSMRCSPKPAMCAESISAEDAVSPPRRAIELCSNGSCTPPRRRLFRRFCWSPPAATLPSPAKNWLKSRSNSTNRSGGGESIARAAKRMLSSERASKRVVAARKPITWSDATANPWPRRNMAKSTNGCTTRGNGAALAPPAQAGAAVFTIPLGSQFPH